MQNHLPDHWIEKLCALLSIAGWRTGVFPHQVVRFFTAWERCEGGTATWNPLNTTNHVHSAEGNWQGVDYNSIGVCNFDKPIYGLMATSATLLGGHYDALVAGLRAAETSGVTAEMLVQNHSVEIKTWGTSTKLMLEILQEIP